jgi:hypothetical protein
MTDAAGDSVLPEPLLEFPSFVLLQLGREARRICACRT